MNGSSLSMGSFHHISMLNEYRGRSASRRNKKGRRHFHLKGDGCI